MWEVRADDNNGDRIATNLVGTVDEARDLVREWLDAGMTVSVVQLDPNTSGIGYRYTKVKVTDFL